MTTLRCERLADDALLFHLGATAPPVDADANARAHRLAAGVRARAPAWLVDLVPAYASLAVFFDDTRIDAERVRAFVARLSGEDAAGATPAPPRLVDVPVAYGGAFGEDLDSAARELGMSPEALVERHSAATYTVAMIGFAPGFPYLSGLDPALALPRLATPRTRVPAGSVAIGGAQTGLYPRESPGGWRLLGRTPLVLFDPARAAPGLLAPGDRVRFRPIGADEFARLETRA